MAGKITPPLRLMLDIAAWQLETLTLTTAERGALLALKMFFWRSGPLLDCDDVLARIAGMDAKDWKKARKALEPLFIVKHGEWLRTDWSDELDAAHVAVQKAKERSRKGHAVRWNWDATGNAPSNARGNATGTATGMPPSMLKNKGTVAARSGNVKSPQPGANDFQSAFLADVLPAEMALGIGGAA